MQQKAGNLVQATCIMALIRYCFRGCGCTTTEKTVVVFLCDESDLQVRALNRVCGGNENPE
ncbi:MAG: hypothetical protein ACP5N0_06750 [Methanosarcina sp.]|uniref:hypothetical protein n=1 Tax=Methanosarcina sp. TaxID=2213 RepID=UPI003BB724D4